MLGWLLVCIATSAFTAEQICGEAAGDAAAYESCLESTLVASEDALMVALERARALAAEVDMRTGHTRALGVLGSSQETFSELRRQSCLLPLELAADEIRGRQLGLACEIRLTRERAALLDDLHGGLQ
jgi:hypothetical protein